jgi:hypothetical protein
MPYPEYEFVAHTTSRGSMRRDGSDDVLDNPRPRTRVGTPLADNLNKFLDERPSTSLSSLVESNSASVRQNVSRQMARVESSGKIIGDTGKALVGIPSEMNMEARYRRALRSSQTEVDVETIPMKSKHSTHKHGAFVKSDDQFAFGQVRALPVEEVLVPVASLHSDTALLPPEERKLQNMFERDATRARRAIRKENVAVGRRKVLENKTMPIGVSGGLETSTMLANPAYQHAMQVANDLVDDHEKHATRRREFLRKKGASERIIPPVSARTTDQMIIPGNTFSFEWMNGNDGGKKNAAQHSQYLRNMQTNGRKYNLITGAEITMPPTIPEKKDRYRGHPSMMTYSTGNFGPGC